MDCPGVGHLHLVSELSSLSSRPLLFYKTTQTVSFSNSLLHSYYLHNQVQMYQVGINSLAQFGLNCGLHGPAGTGPCLFLRSYPKASPPPLLQAPRPYSQLLDLFFCSLASGPLLCCSLCLEHPYPVLHLITYSLLLNFT